MNSWATTLRLEGADEGIVPGTISSGWGAWHTRAMTSALNLPDHGANLAAGPEILAIPGPSFMPERVLAAMGRQMTDIYVGDLVRISEEVFAGLSTVARTTAEPYVAISNGHGAWEMALSNTLSRGDKVLVFDCGGFAAGWAEMATFNGLDVELVFADPGRAVDPAVVEEQLRADARPPGEGRAHGARRYRYFHS